MQIFEASAAQLVHWIRTHPVLGRVVGSLDGELPAIREAIANVVAHARSGGSGTSMTIAYGARTSLEHAALCWHVVNAVADIADCDGEAQGHAALHLAAFLKMGHAGTRDVAEATETLRDVAFDTVFEFLDEQLDGRNALYGLLLKYKQRCEWFWRARLRTMVSDGLEGRVGERALAIDLYDYLLGQGVDFSIEPVVGSGEPDVILREPEGRTVVVDAKYISGDASPSQIKRTLASGFHQVHRYCTDFSEPSGFLVVFSASSRRLSLPLVSQDGFPALQIAGTTIYYLPIHIAAEESASRSGVAHEIAVTPEELKQSIDDAHQSGVEVST